MTSRGTWRNARRRRFQLSLPASTCKPPVPAAGVFAIFPTSLLRLKEPAANLDLNGTSLESRIHGRSVGKRTNVRRFEFFCFVPNLLG